MVMAVEPLAEMADGVCIATLSHIFAEVGSCEEGGQQLHAVEFFAKMRYGQWSRTP